MENLKYRPNKITDPYRPNHTNYSFSTEELQDCSRSQRLQTRRHDIQHNDTQHNDVQHDDTQHNDTQHNRKLNMTLNIMLRCLVSIMISVNYAECRKQAHYAEWHYAECRYA
jgi:hypothetical protein